MGPQATVAPTPVRQEAPVELGVTPLEMGFFQAKLRALWKGAKKEPLFFWLLGVYVIVEYLRPQTVYPAVNLFPFGEVSIGACLLAWFFGGGRFRRLEAMDYLVLGFFFWVVVTSTTAFRSEISWGAGQGFVSWFVLYFLVTNILTTKRRLFLFWALFFLVNLKMSQHGARVWAMRGFSFAGWGATGSPGWFQNSGEFAMQMAGFLGISWCFIMALKPYITRRKWWILLGVFPVTAAMSVMASSSRGGQMAAGAVVVALLLVHRVKLRALVGVALVLMVGWQFLPPEQRARFETMGQDETSQARLTYWKESWRITNEYPVFGIGFENWIPYYEAKHGEVVKEVHNTVLEGSVELGYPGALVFLGLVGMSFVVNARTRRRSKRLGPWGGIFWWMATGLDVGMVGFFFAAQFMSVLFYPIFWMAFALTTALSVTTQRETAALRGPEKPRFHPSQAILSPAHQQRGP